MDAGFPIEIKVESNQSALASNDPACIAEPAKANAFFNAKKLLKNCVHIWYAVYTFCVAKTAVSACVLGFDLGLT